MNATFTYNGVIYDATSGLEIDRLPKRPVYTGAHRKPDLELLHRLNCQDVLAQEKKDRIESLHAGATPFDAKARPPMVHPEVDEDETPWDRAVIRLRRDLNKPRDFDAWARKVQVREAMRLQLRKDAVDYPLPCVDPDATRSPEPFGVIYEDTADTALARVDAFVWLRLDGDGNVEFASLESQENPVIRLKARHRRTVAKDIALVPLYADPPWEADDTAMVPEDERAYDLSILNDLHRYEREAAGQDRRRLEDASDVARITIPGVAAPANRAEFDWERQKSNRDAPVRLAVSGGRKRWVVQDRAFPGEENAALWSNLRLRDGERVQDPHVWATSLRSRFNVRRYVDAISAAFDDSPEFTFNVVDEWKRTRKQRGAAERSASWQEVEAWIEGVYTEFRERCFLDCVGEDVGDGAWMKPLGQEVDDEDHGLSYEDLHGFHGVRVDLGHAVYQVDLISKTPPTQKVVSRSAYKSTRATHMRPTRPSERGVFTMDEVVKGLLATARRMP